MRAKVRNWLLYWLAWAAIAGLYVAALAAEIPLGRAVRGGILAAASAGLLGVVVWRLSGRVPWPAMKRARFLALHLLSAIVYVAVWVGSIYGRIAAEAGADVAAAIFRAEGAWTVLMGFWLYGILAGVSYAIRAEGRAREERQAAERAEALRARAETLRARAELRALRARFNPHFLFNTLHGLKSLVRRDPENAILALERLGELLRYVVDLEGEETDEVRLADELAFARNYLALEQLRLGDRLHVIETIEPEALECGVPALTLQPLVENAIRYGIAPRARGGTLRVSAYCRGETLVVQVEDDGPGAVAEEVLTAPGLGLRTVRQRLEARFAGRATFELDTRPEKGFTVRLAVPVGDVADGDAA